MLDIARIHRAALTRTHQALTQTAQCVLNVCLTSARSACGAGSSIQLILCKEAITRSI